MRLRVLLLCMLACIGLTACDSEDAIKVLEAHRDEMRSQQIPQDQMEDAADEEDGDNLEPPEAGNSANQSSEPKIWEDDYPTDEDWVWGYTIPEYLQEIPELLKALDTV